MWEWLVKGFCPLSLNISETFKRSINNASIISFLSAYSLATFEYNHALCMTWTQLQECLKTVYPIVPLDPSSARHFALDTRVIESCIFYSCLARQKGVSECWKTYFSLLGCVNRRFGGKYRLHLQGRNIRERGTSVSRWLQSADLREHRLIIIDSKRLR
jgi:hypothetical protein